MSGLADDEVVQWLFFDVAEERCQWCGKRLVWENRGREGQEAWELHHHPPRSRMNKTFRGVISPDIPLYGRIICWQCHKKTFDSDFPSAFDILR